jgi:sugar (pentulose or hexulose) kinase
MGKYILAMDSGTSVVKAVLFDYEGNEIAVANENTPVESPHPGWQEFDLDTDWNACVKATRAVMAKAGVTGADITAIGVTGKGVGLVFVDAQGKPARKGILWNDGRAKDIVSRWDEDGTLDKIFDITAGLNYTGEPGTVAAWVAENEPEVWERTETACLPIGWLTYKLTGQISTDGEAMLSLCDPNTRQYSEEVFQLLGIPHLREKFAPLVEPWEIAGQVTEAAAELTGLQAGTPVVKGTHDVCSCALGSGAIENGQACVILGTAHIIEMATDRIVREPKIGLFMSHALPGRYLKLISPFVATVNVDFFLQHMGAGDKMEAEKRGQKIFDYLEAEVAKIPLGSNGVIYHPYLNPAGERAPFVKYTAKGNFFGLGTYTPHHALLRAIYEGIAFATRDCLEASPIPVTDVRLTGGGANSDVWCQIMADVLNLPVRVPVGTEFGAKGIALDAAVATGVFKDFQEGSREFVKIVRNYEPCPKKYGIYSEWFKLYRSIYKNLWHDWDLRQELLDKFGQ